MVNTRGKMQTDAQMMLQDVKLAIAAIGKNSKLRAHYLKLVMMNNIMRAFVVIYDLEDRYDRVRSVLTETLCRVEARKDRAWFTSDKIALQQAFELYEELLLSSEEEQLHEIMQFVESNREGGRWAVLSKKTIKAQRASYA